MSNEDCTHNLTFSSIPHVCLTPWVPSALPLMQSPCGAKMEVPLALAAVIRPNSAALLFINSISDSSHTQSLQTPGRHEKNVLKLEMWGKKRKKNTYLLSNYAPPYTSFLSHFALCLYNLFRFCVFQIGSLHHGLGCVRIFWKIFYCC